MEDKLLEEIMEFFSKKIKELKEKCDNEAKDKLLNISFKDENLEDLRKATIQGVLDLPKLNLSGKARALMEVYFLATAENMIKLLEEIDKIEAKELFLCQYQKN